MASNEEVIDLLRTAYSMELETVMNYLANSNNLDGVRAEEIKKSLAIDVIEELGHATQLGQRIKQIGGLVPGSMSVKLGNQTQPSPNTTDVVGVIKAVIAAEEAACAIQENHSRHRRGRLRHAGFGNPTPQGRRAAPGALQRLFEGIHAELGMPWRFSLPAQGHLSQVRRRAMPTTAYRRRHATNTRGSAIRTPNSRGRDIGANAPVIAPCSWSRAKATTC